MKKVDLGLFVVPAASLLMLLELATAERSDFATIKRRETVRLMSPLE